MCNSVFVCIMENPPLCLKCLIWTMCPMHLRNNEIFINSNYKWYPLLSTQCLSLLLSFSSYIAVNCTDFGFNEV